MAITTTYAFSNVTPEFDVNTTIVGNQTAASIALMANGQIAYAYQDDEATAPNENVLARYMTQSGGAGGAAEFNVQAGPGDVEILPRILALSNGNVVVVYQDSDASSSGSAGGTSIAYRMFDPAGDGVNINASTFAQLVENESDDQTAPAIAALTGGGFVIALVDQTSGSDNTNAVSVYRFGNNGVQLGGQIVVVTASAGDPNREPAVAGLSTGGFVVVWSQDVASGTGTLDYDIFAQKYTSAGVADGTRISVATPVDNQRNPTVTANATGGFVVAWEDEELGSAAAGNIGFATVSAAGVVVSSGNIIATGRQFDPSITLLTTDISVITYSTNEAGNDDVRAAAIQGGTVLTNYALEDPSLNQNQSAVVAVGNGEIVTAWTEFGSSADGSGSGIQSQRDQLVRTLNSDAAGDEMSGDLLRDIISGNGGNDSLYGNGGKDELYGGAGLDYMSGGTGDDYMSGGADKDVFFGGSGTDIIVGGGGDDEFYVQAGDASDIIVEYAGEGNDRIFSEISYALAFNSEVETLSTTTNAGVAGINLTGSDLANIIIGNNGANIIDGRGGNDILYGLGGTDYFTFSFAPNNASNVDTIADFSSVDDIIFLDDIVFAGMAGGFLAAGAFRAGGGAQTAVNGSQQVIHDTATGDLWYDADGAGGLASVRFATVGAGTVVNSFDFFGV